MMKVKDFISQLKKAEKSKTLYVLGCFGAPMTEKNKQRYTKNLSYNTKRKDIILAQSDDTFGFDCVCLIKGIIWGWNADKSKTYGGAKYAVGMPDYSADGIFSKKYVTGISKDFSKIKPGAVVHMPGHVGVYIGCGQVIECSPKWKNCVQVTYLGNISEYKKGNFRIWTDYGYLPCVDYSEEITPKPITIKTEKNEDKPVYYTVVPGDTLTKIAYRYQTTIDSILEKNCEKYPRMSKSFICVGWILEV